MHDDVRGRHCRHSCRVGLGRRLFIGAILGAGLGANAEVEEKTVSVRRLGEKQTSVQALADVTKALATEATPPDRL